MFTIIYPMFERGRIMKRELSLALRDYSFGLAKLQYSDLTDGVITGCELSVGEKLIRVEPGLVKFNKFVYVMNEAQAVYYEPTEQYSSLKIRFSTTAAVTSDFVSYTGLVCLDESVNLRENELELCRFKLKRGSRLRNDYTSFEDIQTEFDTVNLVDASVAGIGRPGFSRTALRIFAEEALAAGVSDAWDVTFCAQCLGGEAVHRSVIEAYLRAKTGVEVGGNVEVFEGLCAVLRGLGRGGGAVRGGGKARRSVWVE